MSTTVIGDKNIFAFEYEIESEEPILMIRNALWVRGNFLGNYEDSGTLSAVYKGLSRLISKDGNFYEEEFLNKSPEEIMLIMIPNLNEPEKKFWDFSKEEQERLVKYDKYLFSFGENYDSFVIRIYAVNGMYHFIWQLQPEKWMESEVKCYQGYDRSVQHGIVSLQNLESVFNELQKTFPEGNVK